MEAHLLRRRERSRACNEGACSSLSWQRHASRPLRAPGADQCGLRRWRGAPGGGAGGRGPGVLTCRSCWSLLMRNCLRCSTEATAEMDRFEFCAERVRTHSVTRPHTHTLVSFCTATPTQAHALHQSITAVRVRGHARDRRVGVLHSAGGHTHPPAHPLRPRALHFPHKETYWLSVRMTVEDGPNSNHFG